MSRGECPTPIEERGACPVLAKEGACYSDRDHIVPQRYRFMGLLVRKYIYTPENKQQICRWEHEEKTLTESPDLIPDEEFMLNAVHRAWRQGDIHLTAKQYERLFAVSPEEAA